MAEVAAKWLIDEDRVDETERGLELVALACFRQAGAQGTGKEVWRRLRGDQAWCTMERQLRDGVRPPLSCAGAGGTPARARHSKRLASNEVALGKSLESVADCFYPFFPFSSDSPAPPRCLRKRQQTNKHKTTPLYAKHDNIYI